MKVQRKTLTDKQLKKFMRCGRKVRYRSKDAAQADVDILLKQRIYDQMAPASYLCDYGNHYHVGHSRNRQLTGV